MRTLRRFVSRSSIHPNLFRISILTRGQKYIFLKILSSSIGRSRLLSISELTCVFLPRFVHRNLNQRHTFAKHYVWHLEWIFFIIQFTFMNIILKFNAKKRYIILLPIARCFRIIGILRILRHRHSDSIISDISLDKRRYSHIRRVHLWFRARFWHP